MRIIAGTYRGKKLFTPNNDNVRPTADRAREAIFSILNSQIGGSWCEHKLLDVFAGTGAFGLEAISRGIQEICLVDKDTSLAAKNAGLFPNEKNRIKLLKADALSLPRASSTYDIVFMDAPYDKGLSEKCLIELQKQGWLEDGAVCIIETEKKEKFNIPSGFELLDERTYGIAKFVFLIK